MTSLKSRGLDFNCSFLSSEEGVSLFMYVAIVCLATKLGSGSSPSILPRIRPGHGPGIIAVLGTRVTMSCRRGSLLSLQGAHTMEITRRCERSSKHGRLLLQRSQENRAFTADEA